MRTTAIIALFVLGFWAMAAGGILGGAVHQTPSVGISALGCLISTVGLGMCLSGLMLAKSRLSTRVAEGFSVVAILYGFFNSLLNLVYQSQAGPTLFYGIYMVAISIAAVLIVRRGYIQSSRPSGSGAPIGR